MVAILEDALLGCIQYPQAWRNKRCTAGNPFGSWYRGPYKNPVNMFSGEHISTLEQGCTPQTEGKYRKFPSLPKGHRFDLDKIDYEGPNLTRSYVILFETIYDLDLDRPRLIFAHQQLGRMHTHLYISPRAAYL